MNAHGERREVTLQLNHKPLEMLLSANICLKLKLIQVSGGVKAANVVTDKLNNFLGEYKDPLQKLGQLSQPMNIYTCETARSIQQPSRTRMVVFIKAIGYRVKVFDKLGVIQQGRIHQSGPGSGQKLSKKKNVLIEVIQTSNIPEF